MNIKILTGKEGAKMAKGLTVVIDVFRAFSTACYMINQGAKNVIPIGDINTAYQLKNDNPDFLLAGERDGYIQPGFDMGNSPSQVLNSNIKGKTIVFTTTYGTQGIVNAKNADEIITGSFVNIGAIIKYIKNKNPENVSLICTEIMYGEAIDEDKACAHYIKNALLGHPNDFNKVKEHLHNEGYTKEFTDPEIKSHPLEDLDLCMSLDKFNFILKVEPYKNGLVCLKKIN